MDYNAEEMDEQEEFEQQIQYMDTSNEELLG